MYIKLDESLAHSSLNFLLEWAGRKVNEMYVWQICAGYKIIYANYLVLRGWEEVQVS